MFDYVADYVADYASKRATLVFWSDIYALMENGYTEDRALKVLDPRGEKRAKYLRPESFPSCFDEST